MTMVHESDEKPEHKGKFESHWRRWEPNARSLTKTVNIKDNVGILPLDHDPFDASSCWRLIARLQKKVWGEFR